MSNATQNKVDDRLTATLSPEALGGDYDVVVANILAKPLIEAAAEIAGRVRRGGTLILSGILADQAATVAAAYAEQIDFAAPTERDGWACLYGVRR